MTVTNSEKQSGKVRKIGSGTTPAEPEADYEETSRQRGNSRISKITKKPGANRVTSPLVTPLVDNRSSMEDALIRIVDSVGEQSEQMSIRMSKLERERERERESSSR